MQSELFPTAPFFWPSLSPVPSSEWVRLWFPRWPPCVRRADGFLGGRLSSRRRALFSSSTAWTLNSNACRSPAPPTGADDWASKGDSGSGFTVGLEKGGNWFYIQSDTKPSHNKFNHVKNINIQTKKKAGDISKDWVIFHANCTLIKGFI